MIKVALNGYGRIGQDVFKIWAGKEDSNFEIVVINGVKSINRAYRDMVYDSIYGRYAGVVEKGEDHLLVDGRKVYITNERDPDALDWGKYGVDLVIDATGFYRNRELIQKHLDAGAKKVLVTAPAEGDDITIVYGVNDEMYDPEKHHMVSNASCTTNCLAPVAKVLDEKFGIERGLMTTVHAYTNDQNLVDGEHKDPRRARAAAINIIPTTTGAAQAVSLVLPQLEGRFDGMALRVPVPTVSLVDLTAELKVNVTAEEINAAMKEASEGELKGILGYTEEPLVSTDFIRDERSSIFDALSTAVLKDNLVKVMSWYDNEWGYSTRVVDLAELMVEKGI